MDNFVLLARKRPGAEWEKPFLVVENVEGVRTFDEVLWIDPLGRLRLYWAQAHMHMDGKEGVWESVCDQPDAEQPVFSRPRRLCDGIMLNKPTVLGSGRWLYTVARCPLKPFHPMNVGTVIFNDPDEQQRNAQVYASDDNGCTVSLLGQARFSKSDFFEHMLYECSDGSLRMLSRSAPVLYESVSRDGGITWSNQRPTQIGNPCSRFHVRRLMSGRLLLINHRNFIGRNNLYAQVSQDDGKTWNDGLLLDERSQVSYPDAVQDAEGLIHIIYDHDRYGSMEIMMAQITEEDILTGTIVSPDSKLKICIDRA